MAPISTNVSVSFASEYERLKQLNERLKEENTKLKAENSFLQNQHYQLAHDLKGPLSNQQVLLSMCNLDNTNEVVIHLYKSISQMEVLVKSNLSASSAEDSPITSVDLASVMTDILVLLQGIISHYNVIVQSDFLQAPSILYQPLEIQSILYNLIHNAIKYSHPNRPPQIKVSSRFEGEYICIKVQDNGQGMHLKNAEACVFNKNTQLNKSQEGHGLGLYLIKEFLELRGGRIECKTTPELGSIFYVFLKPQI